ncbi:hypothetical protein [Flavobacterium sp.]|uniref:hypothetical protein n=1 Tax=Flavobacterium sp. TaxID=239 RepID=UPI0039E4038C
MKSVALVFGAVALLIMGFGKPKNGFHSKPYGDTIVAKWVALQMPANDSELPDALLQQLNSKAEVGENYYQAKVLYPKDSTFKVINVYGDVPVVRLTTRSRSVISFGETRLSNRRFRVRFLGSMCFPTKNTCCMLMIIGGSAVISKCMRRLLVMLSSSVIPPKNTAITCLIASSAKDIRQIRFRTGIR